MRLEDLAEITRGISTTKADLVPSAGNTYRVIQIRHIWHGIIAPPKDLKVIYLSARRKPARFEVKRGDILVAMLGEEPKVTQLATSPRSCVADGHLAIVRPRSVPMGKRILKYLTSEEGQETLRSMHTGTTIPGLTLAALRGLDIP